MKSIKALSLVVCGLPAASWAQGNDPGRISGVLFGDYYTVRGHNDASIVGKDGFWVRRLNLVYDKNLEKNLSMQVRIETKDPGDFSTSQNMEPFVKDAWIRYTASGHKFTVGLLPTPTWGPAEERLGYRPIEKSPLDLYRMGSARDKGISIQGPIAGGKGDYMVVFGDGSGTKSSTGDTQALYGRVGYKLTPEVSTDLYADCWKKTAGVNWRTVKAELFVIRKPIKAGLAYMSQRRTKPGEAALTLDVVSAYLEAKANDRLSPFVRCDVVSNAIPDADKIEFFKMSKDGKPTFFLIGVRVKISDQVEVVPSLETVTYRRGPGGLTPKQDSIFRVTFSAKF
jgi:hypothetical protein